MSKAFEAYHKRMERNHNTLKRLALNLIKAKYTVIYPSQERLNNDYNHQERIEYVTFIYKEIQYTFGFYEVPYRWSLRMSNVSHKSEIKQWTDYNNRPLANEILQTIDKLTMIKSKFTLDCLKAIGYNGVKNIEGVFKWLKENNKQLFQISEAKDFDKLFAKNVIYTIIKTGYPTIEPCPSVYYHQFTSEPYRLFRDTQTSRRLLISESGEGFYTSDIFVNETHPLIEAKAENRIHKIQYKHFVPFIPKEIRGKGEHLAFINIKDYVQNKHHPRNTRTAL